MEQYRIKVLYDNGKEEVFHSGHVTKEEIDNICNLVTKTFLYDRNGYLQFPNQDNLSSFINLRKVSRVNVLFDNEEKPEIENEIKERIMQRVLGFIRESGIQCVEDVYQCDRVSENSYEFIGDLFNIMAPLLTTDNLQKEKFIANKEK